MSTTKQSSNPHDSSQGKPLADQKAKRGRKPIYQPHVKTLPYRQRVLQVTHRNGSKPPHPLSAFCLFAEEKREELRGAHPDLPIRQMKVKIRLLWKRLQEKDSYLSQAKQDYQDYKELLREWQNYKERCLASQENSASSESAREDRDPEASQLVNGAKSPSLIPGGEANIILKSSEISQSINKEATIEDGGSHQEEKGSYPEQQPELKHKQVKQVSLPPSRSVLLGSNQSGRPVYLVIRAEQQSCPPRQNELLQENQEHIINYNNNHHATSLESCKAQSKQDLEPAAASSGKIIARKLPLPSQQQACQQERATEKQDSDVGLVRFPMSLNQGSSKQFYTNSPIGFESRLACENGNSEELWLSEPTPVVESIKDFFRKLQSSSNYK